MRRAALATAQRLLLERQDRSAVEPLRQLCSSSDQPLARAHAAWLLETFAALERETVVKLLHDEHPRVREQAVLLAERWLAQTPEIQERLGQIDACVEHAERAHNRRDAGRQWNSERRKVDQLLKSRSVFADS